MFAWKMKLEMVRNVASWLVDALLKRWMIDFVLHMYWFVIQFQCLQNTDEKTLGTAERGIEKVFVRQLCVHLFTKKTARTHTDSSDFMLEPSVGYIQSKWVKQRKKKNRYIFVRLVPLEKLFTSFSNVF